jgi:hypothetical protein
MTEQSGLEVAGEPVPLQQVLNICLRLVAEDEQLKLKFINEILAGRLKEARETIAQHNGEVPDAEGRQAIPEEA